jgi:aminomethyltransferase
VSGLRRTPLHDLHRRLGARMVAFAGFEMPVHYGSILDEHAAVRERAGLFDVSHMGQIHVTGAPAEATLERLLTSPVASLRVGRVRYGLLCNAEGGVLDDVTVYRRGEQSFFLCVNAANVEKDYRWVVRHALPGAEVRDRSAETGLLALQGPAAAAVLAGVTRLPVRELARFAWLEGELAGAAALVSRTGYTGSDGFEIYLPADRAAGVFEALLEAGRAHGLRPAGLGARDTLRLEAALPLYGHELDEETSPLEARLDRFVKLDAGGFIGVEALRRQRAQGLRRRLVGFLLDAPGVARAGHDLLHDGGPVGRVTSGAPSPTLGKSIGLGYVPPALGEVGTRLAVSIRGRAVPARVVETPFIRAGAREVTAARA